MNKQLITVYSFDEIPKETKGIRVASKTVAETILRLGGYSEAWFLHRNQFTKFMYVWETEYDALHKRTHA